ncbi:MULTISPECIES: DNA alkylation repair protein [Pseudanabaena]|uniref:DNA alkylation repair protein n=1 Tax=Pseudanabaena TaxID=1152 RepID=UPI002478F371|nr:MULTISPECIES: DNA alkylation repair protein [Pseudanabaena]MEA5485808.1 DNA alkylation repair protein [Pseudanabaena sp. CCNP1317]WGS72301.1 DNA alkylation repair protein [Pseudanabaena galeata CCNP1313]
MLTHADLKSELDALASPTKAIILSRFFKTGKGEYGEGDRFLGVTVPEQRQLAKKFISLGFDAIEKLLQTDIHEYRLTALLILTYQYPKADTFKREEIYAFYLKHTKWINNWDLVDVTCRQILGRHLLHQDRNILQELARSPNFWEQRIAIVSTLEFIKHQQFTDTLAIATVLLDHPHDLIHKAVGWMLREVGKQDRQILIEFLDVYCQQMPRTMLRYAIEHFDEPNRKAYLSKPTSSKPSRK